MAMISLLVLLAMSLAELLSCFSFRNSALNDSMATVISLAFLSAISLACNPIYGHTTEKGFNIKKENQTDEHCSYWSVYKRDYMKKSDHQSYGNDVLH